MSALNFAKHAFSREKPHSSTTDWIEILTSSNIAEEAYDGIPELVDSINLQASGPAEASRALRKKLKHGNSHQQYRALVLLKALVENGGPKFAAMVQDSQFLDALKMVANDSLIDRRVRKKLTLVLGSWRDQYRDDPSMTFIAGLYKQLRLDSERAEKAGDLSVLLGSPNPDEERRQRRKEKQAKEKRRQEEDGRKKEQSRSKRQPFDFEKEKPRVLGSIVEASQASSNLVNAVTLVNPDNDIYATNTRVQDCLEKAKAAKKIIVRYIQLVENEELIGTLIEANDRINSAIETYEQLSAAQADALAEKLNGTRLEDKNGSHDIKPQFSDHGRSNERGKDKATERYVHPDLEDLSFGALGSSSNHLPPPLQPSSPSSKQSNYKDQDIFDTRGSLSEYSDYESSDEGTRQASSSRRPYVHVSDDEEDYLAGRKAAPLTSQADDPFADPFADDAGASRK